MSIDAPEPPAERLPPELRTLPPYPLPSWARQQTLHIVLLAAAATAGLVSVFVFQQPRSGVVGLVPAFVGAAFVISAWTLSAKRRVFTTVDAAATGLVLETSAGRGSWRVHYDFSTPAGPRRGTSWLQSAIVVPAFGFRPERGNTVFVVYDSRDPGREAAWGFALPPGVHRKPGSRAVPSKILAVVSLTIVVVCGAGLWLMTR